MEMFHRFCYWTLIRLSGHWAWLHQGCWCYKNWLIDQQISTNMQRLARSFQIVNSFKFTPFHPSPHEITILWEYISLILSITPWPCPCPPPKKRKPFVLYPWVTVTTPEGALTCLPLQLADSGQEWRACVAWVDWARKLYSLYHLPLLQKKTMPDSTCIHLAFPVENVCKQTEVAYAIRLQ